MYYKLTCRPSIPQKFNVPDIIKHDIFLIVEEAARNYYWGSGGWQDTWPLDFEIISDNGKILGEYTVWILSSYPDFDVIEK